MDITPQAVVIPKETDRLEQGKYGPVFPRTPACYGFTIIADVKPGRAEAIRDHGHALAKALEADPHLLAPLKLHYLRWVLFDDDTRFMYQGIFDTDFDKYTEDAIALFTKAGVSTAFENLVGFPEDWRTNPEAFVRFVREHHCPSFIEYGEYPYVTADEIKKALRVKSALSEIHDQRQRDPARRRRLTAADRRRDMDESRTARTYNQNHVPRPYTPGRRRVSIYVSWSYPAEAGRNPAELDNRFSTMTEVRRVNWPAYEDPRWCDPLRFQQGIAGALELFFWGWAPFQQFAEETTGHPVPVYQSVDQAGFRTLLDERVLDDTDTLFVFGLDHMITGQEAEPAEIQALRHFLAREGTCLVLGPHHDVGASNDLAVRDAEYHHHGDALVPRQQRFARYVRGLMRGLGVPVENRYGLRPAVQESKKIAPLSVNRDLDARGWLDGVTTFNFHLHLPHYAVTTDEPDVIHVLARQPIDPSRPAHPFTDAGNTEFNMFLWMPPAGERAGDVLLADSTIFSSLFGGDESLRAFWKNIVSAK